MSHSRFALILVLISLLSEASLAQYGLPAVALDKNDPELRAVLTEIEADAEKARVKAKIPGLSIVIVHDQDVLWLKALDTPISRKRSPPIHKRSTGQGR